MPRSMKSSGRRILMRSLEHMYLLAFLPAWHRNELKRLVKTPKPIMAIFYWGQDIF